MKISKVNYLNGEALILLEDDPNTSYGLIGGEPITKHGTRTYCISLEGKTTIKEITAELKAMVAKKQADTTEQTFDNLHLKSLEGTDL